MTFVDQPAFRPRPLSRLALLLARQLPRGHWRLIKFAADRDPALWDISIPLTALSGLSIRADLRESVFMNFLRYGCIPGQVGHDRLFNHLIRPGDMIFDVGANVGYTMLIFASLSGREGKVIALEPGRRAFALLARNSERLPNVTALQVAASDGTGEAIFYETLLSDISSLEPITNANRFVVPTISLDRIAEEQGKPDFVKIDVEGHEPHVLRGMSSLLSQSSPPIVLFEALDDRLRTECVETIRSLASAASIFRLRSDGSLAPDITAPGTNDYLFLPEWGKSRLSAGLGEWIERRNRFPSSGNPEA